MAALITHTENTKTTQIGHAFAKHYYELFDTNKRDRLATLYTEHHSQLTWEGQVFVGASSIMKKLQSFPFNKIQHTLKSVDVQSTAPGILLMCSGDVKVDDSPNPLKFSQVFHLFPVDQTCKKLLGEIRHLSTELRLETNGCCCCCCCFCNGCCINKAQGR
jgi:hypothetical protein